LCVTVWIVASMSDFSRSLGANTSSSRRQWHRSVIRRSQHIDLSVLVVHSLDQQFGQSYESPLQHVTVDTDKRTTLIASYSCYDCGIHCRNLGPNVSSFVIGCFNQLLHPFNDLFSTSRHQKGKPLWILLEQEMMGWQWHQLDHIQIICTLLQTDNHASSSPLSFYRLDALPAAQPTASKHWRHRLF